MSEEYTMTEDDLPSLFGEVVSNTAGTWVAVTWLLLAINLILIACSPAIVIAVWRALL